MHFFLFKFLLSNIIGDAIQVSSSFFLALRRGDRMFKRDISSHSIQSSFPPFSFVNFFMINQKSWEMLFKWCAFFELFLEKSQEESGMINLFKENQFYKLKWVKIFGLFLGLRKQKKMNKYHLKRFLSNSVMLAFQILKMKKSPKVLLNTCFLYLERLWVSMILVKWSKHIIFSQWKRNKAFWRIIPKWRNFLKVINIWFMCCKTLCWRLWRKRKNSRRKQSNLVQSYLKLEIYFSIAFNPIVNELWNFLI